MKRKLGWFGLGFAGAELAAANLPPLVCVPAAAFLALLAFWKRRRNVRIPLLGALCGLAWFALFTLIFVQPCRALAGQTVTCTAVVETDAEASYSDSRLRGTLRLTEIDGKPARLRVQCPSFPGESAGERFEASFALSSLPDNRYRLSRNSKGVYLQAEYLGSYRGLAASKAPRFALFRLRQRWSAVLRRWLPKRLDGMEAAMLLADKSHLEDAVQQAFRAAGVNRISFGVQSARDSQLKTLGRPHTAKQARAAFAAARRAGFENISGDIMLALPHYTQAEFDETLELIEDGGAAHISAYLLKIEPDSAFGRTPPEGLPTSDEAADFYLYAVEQLEHHGYRQYEISNFARPGYEGKHNLIYWDCGDYLGIGPAAHSCMGGKRFYYPADTEAFLRDEAAPVMDGGCGAEDYLILQLRLRKGLSLDEYKKRYGREFSTAHYYEEFVRIVRDVTENGGAQ